MGVFPSCTHIVYVVFMHSYSICFYKSPAITVLVCLSRLPRSWLVLLYFFFNHFNLLYILSVVCCMVKASSSVVRCMVDYQYFVMLICILRILRINLTSIYLPHGRNFGNFGALIYVSPSVKIDITSSVVIVSKSK